MATAEPIPLSDEDRARFDDELAIQEQADAARVSELLEDVFGIFDRYVAFPSIEAHVAVAAWVLHTWTVEYVSSTPRLALLSAEPESGKSRVLEVLELLTPRPMFTHSITSAALYRTIEKERPTILMDEADTVFGSRKSAENHEDLRGLLNAGHRRGAVAVRMVGQGTRMEAKKFRVFAPVALAGIGSLPDTITTRAIVVRMRRRKAGEQIEPFEHEDASHHAGPIRRALDEWSTSDRAKSLQRYRPEMPIGVVDRPADVWRPLIAVGDLAEDHWSKMIRRAAQHFTETGRDRSPSLGVRLLADLRALYDRMDVDRITSAEICRQLVAMPEAPWGDLGGREIDQRRLARFLGEHEIRSRDMKMPDGKTVLKGYYRDAFTDAWDRYLPPRDATESDTATDPASTDDSDPDAVRNAPLPDATGSGRLRTVADTATPESPSGDRGSSGVADVADERGERGT